MWCIENKLGLPQINIFQIKGDSMDHTHPKLRIPMLKDFTFGFENDVPDGV